MTKTQALESIINSYDAFYIENKYGDNTHEKEFELLSELEGNKVINALNWIRHNYDCYYKEDYDNENSPFHYLRKLIKEQGD